MRKCRRCEKCHRGGVPKRKNAEGNLGKGVSERGDAFLAGNRRPVGNRQSSLVVIPVLRAGLIEPAGIAGDAAVPAGNRPGAAHFAERAVFRAAAETFKTVFLCHAKVVFDGRIGHGRPTARKTVALAAAGIRHPRAPDGIPDAGFNFCICFSETATGKSCSSPRWALPSCITLSGTGSAMTVPLRKMLQPVSRCVRLSET